MNEAQFFQPASNAKLFTTATALALLGGGTTFETQVLARGIFHGADKLTGDVVLVGSGDANLSGRELPYVPPALRPKRQPGAPPLPEPDSLRYLAEMADQVAATGLKVVNGDVIGDDTLFPWQPYAEDWSIDDTVWGYGAPVSALTITDNQLKIVVTPGATAGGPATVSLDPALAYYTVDVSGLATGAAKSGSHVQMERALGSKVLRVYGSIAVDSQPDEEEIAIHDPAEYAAIALKGMLEARGITVTGVARARHVISTETKDIVRASHETPAGMDWTKTYSVGKKPLACSDACANMAQTPATVLASHTSPALREDVVVTNKVSQNLHAEMFLHDVGSAVLGDGSTLGGARVVRAFLEHAGVNKDDFVFFDGSGLSGHDLVTPRATTRLLRYAVAQPWFADWRRSLPVGGEDGSLAGRFPSAPLKDHVFAKTGTLGEARALSGYLECASGKTVIFSIMVGNHAPRNNSDRDAMDKVVAAIAANN
ncbi:MAG: D-alanyl-D-alanine carboxypeptidase/D-alanyl-D-alanine-endopeptidase [Acidobacteriaceae bacterium]|nr:D-alanyl-D-alanine carboxypeptidase/D-alanyl-D-alanine-endopeptidase [Acidobacteriaceae bacterium]